MLLVVFHLRVSGRPETKGPLVQVRTVTLSPARHVLLKVRNATIEVTGRAPFNLGCALALGPVLAELLGADQVALSAVSKAHGEHPQGWRRPALRRASTDTSSILTQA